MLSYDSLVAQAKERGMPAGKLRGLAREYLQVLTLKTLYGRKGAERLCFLGGTALRLGFGLPRFSEDLDFDTSVDFRTWKALVEDCAHAMGRRGFTVEARASEKGSLLAGDLRFKGFLQAYRLSENPQEKLRIKLEANRPSYRLDIEPRVVSGFGEMVPVPFGEPGLLFAEKILALLAREMGRDIYDLFFMAGKRWIPDRRILAAKGIMKPLEAILERLTSWSPKRLEQMARALEPFLFEPDQAQLVAQAHRLLPGTLEYLKEGPG